jgi:signal transduction histidine kinase
VRGLEVPIEGSLAGPVYETGRPRRVADGREGAARAKALDPERVGPMLLVPLGLGDSARGVISVINPPGGRQFDEVAERLLEAYAAQAVIALELAERRADAERLALFEDRDRIAKDLHDTVIQRLFATAMTLMSAIKITQKREVAVRVQRAVDDLDDTIRQIRSTIFALQAAPDDQSLRGRLHEVVDACAENLGFAPSVRLDGLLDTAVDEAVGEQLLAVVQEALSNVARLARAGEAVVVVEVGDELRLRVLDDGVGIPAEGRRSGLANMAARAEALGGSFAVEPRDGGGTVLTWTVPLND